MKKMYKVVAVLLAMTLLLSACGQGTAKKAEEAQKKIGVVYTVAGLGGASFNDVIHDGCTKAAADFGVKYEYVEPKSIADEETVMDEMSATGEYALIICVGNEQKDAVTNVATKYPNQNFCFIDASVDLPNVANYECKENEGGFLIGVLCAMAEQEGLSDMFNGEKHFGFLGGVNNPIINRFCSGFMAGARYVDPSYTFDYDYVGGFADTTTAKAMATTMYNNGCDVIFHAAGGSGVGMFNAASELGFIAVGVNLNQNGMAPDNIIASMLKKVDNAAYKAIESVVKGEFKGGVVTLTLADGGVGYTNEGSNIKLSDNIVKTLDSIEKDITSGKIVVPDNIDAAVVYTK